MIGYQDIYLDTQTSGEERCLTALSVKEHESGTVTMTLSVLEGGWDTGGQEVQKGEEEHEREWRKGEKQKGKGSWCVPLQLFPPLIYHRLSARRISKLRPD